MDGDFVRRIAFRMLAVVVLLLLPAWGAAPAGAADQEPGRELVLRATKDFSLAARSSESDAANPLRMTDRIQALEFTEIAAGGNHTCGLTPAGGVRCWGDNEYGQLGDGTTIWRSTPVDVIGLPSAIKAIAAGQYHTCALTVDGAVKCWGVNWYGQLGNNSSQDSSTPVDVVGLGSGVSAITAGYDHSCAIAAGGQARCWGNNTYGQLGDNSTITRRTPANVFGLGSGVTAIDAGIYHTCAAVAGGALQCWGRNSQGQLGNNTTTSSSAPVAVVGLDTGVTAVAAGSQHTCALAGDGVKCWGSNSSGQLGDGTTARKLVPVNVILLPPGAIAIAAGSAFSCALVPSADGSLPLSGGGTMCWGWNTFGQLGDGTTSSSTTPVQVSGLTTGVMGISAGAGHVCTAINSAAGAATKCWGHNDYGQLGDGTTTRRSVPVYTLGLEADMRALEAGWRHTCALTVGGGVRCWGNNTFGQLGDGTMEPRGAPVDVGGLDGEVRGIAVGAYHTCALGVDGWVKCWGYNVDGELGNGITTPSSTPVGVTGLASGVTASAAGWYHTCALLSGGGIRCWGSNEFGQLGDGTHNASLTPTPVTGLANGAAPLAAGYGHTCTLVSGGGVKCWGYNAFGQLGDGTKADHGAPADVTGLTSGVSDLAAGGDHTCAILSSTAGGMKCWGYNDDGQVGDGTAEDRSEPVDVTGLTGGVTAMAAGYRHTCALAAGGAVKCWGANGSGQVGDGMWEGNLIPLDVSGLASGGTAIAAGHDHTCVLTGAGRPECWGWDGDGQLGIGTITQRSTPVSVLESLAPLLNTNYPDGQPGSVFTATGSNFPPGTLAALRINGHEIATGIPINASGGFIFFLDTAGAEAGVYAVTVTVNPSATTSLRLSDAAELRVPEGGGEVFAVPGGIGLDKFVYLPIAGTGGGR
jgi:alpha-tubulin suppressor-like RCC1 family protein